MADFIRREDALKVLCNNYAYAAMDVIKRLPAADVAEVVRCKYCRHLGAPLSGGCYDCKKYMLP
jgi:hypothetical protein